MKKIILALSIAILFQLSNLSGQSAWFQPSYSFPHDVKEWTKYFETNGAKDKIEGIYDVTYTFQGKSIRTGALGDPISMQSLIAIAMINGNILHFTISKETTGPEYRYVPIGGGEYKVEYALAEMNSSHRFNGSTSYNPNSISIEGVADLDFEVELFRNMTAQSIKGNKIYSPTKTTLLSKILHSTGTGFFVDNKHLVTNYHVIEKPVLIKKEIKAVISTSEKSVEYICEIVAKDVINDLVILKIIGSNPNVSPIYMNNLTPSLGMKVYTLGYPMTSTLGESIKLSEGIISSEYGYKGRSNSFQLSVPLNRGNSGGPLFTDKGNLIGIVNSGILEAENISYAIKNNFLKKMLNNHDIKYINNSNSESFMSQVQKIKNQVALIKIYIDK